MEEIGIRELKMHASEIMRKVREEGARYAVTYHGKPVGRLIPVDEEGAAGDERHDPWEEMKRLSKQIEDGWQSEKSGLEILSEMRR